jgi:threonine/homoserine/homoserine lactone efflux protein
MWQALVPPPASRGGPWESRSVEFLENIDALVGIATAVVLGAISPGPSFVLVSRTAMTASRPDGMATTLGMGTGAALLALAALAGLQGALMAFPTLYGAIRVIGGLYLAYLGARIWRAASHPVAADAFAGGAEDRRDLRRHFLLGLTTQLTNPATTLVLGSIFAAFMPKSMSLAFEAVLVAVVFAIDFSWYAIVTLLLSSDRPRDVYLRHQGWIDRAAGAVMVGMAGKLMAVALF